LFNINLDDKTKVISIENKRIPKLNWVSEGVEARVLMPNGKWVYGVAEKGVSELAVGTIIQFERFGFVSYDGYRDNVYEFWLAHK